MELPPWILEHSRKVTKDVVEVLVRALRTKHATTVGGRGHFKKDCKKPGGGAYWPDSRAKAKPKSKGKGKGWKGQNRDKKTVNAVEDDDEEEYHDEQEQEQPENEEGLGAMFVCALSKQGEIVIDIGIDSCAAASVIPRGLLQLPVRRDGRGGTYYTATKEPISDEGLQIVEGRAHGNGPHLGGTVSGCFCISHIDVIEPDG